MNRISRCKKQMALFFITAALMLQGCSGSHPLRSYLQKLGIVDPDEYLEIDEEDEGGSSLFSWGEDQGTIPGLWSPQGSEKWGREDAGDTWDDIISATGSTVDTAVVNSDIDDLISGLRKETGLEEATSRREVKDQNVSETEETYSGSSAQRLRESIGLTTVGIMDKEKSQKGLYAFEHLNSEGKQLYVEILSILENMADDVVISTMDEEVMDTVFNFVIADHPEIFYVEGYHYVRYTKAGVLVKISFGGIYTCDAQERISREAKIEDYVKKCFEGIGEPADEYETAKYIYEYVIRNTEYDNEAIDNQNICSVFIRGRSVCQGYARATQYLLNRRRIEATLVTGKARGENHAWVLALIDGSYTYIDPTWGDSSYQLIYDTENQGGKLPAINYAYLCITTQELKKTHTISDTMPVPVCTDMSCNYYVREKEYFISADLDAVAELFERRYEDGSNNVTIKCSTRAVYDELVDRLITHQLVVGYLHGVNDTFSYTLFNDQYILVIWL